MSAPGEMRAARAEEGSASLELVGVLPFMLLAILVAAQLAMAGASLWAAAIGARADARAALVHRGGGGVAVEAPVPRLIPGMPRMSVVARTRLGPGGH